LIKKLKADNTVYMSCLAAGATQATPHIPIR